MELKLISRYKSFDGFVEFYSHQSRTCQAEMRFSVYLPPAAQNQPVPVLYWLSGLTCTDENFIVKAGAQQHAARHGMMIVAPDTSPRNTGVETVPARWDFGAGASFYVNATREPWSKHYQMYDYVTKELPEVVMANFPALSGSESISGHSMGGHGALVAALRNPARFRSLSAFAPIVAPMQCPWGEQAFLGYLGEDRALWRDYDATCLIEKARTRIPILIDQGLNDTFLNDQLKTHLLAAAGKSCSYPLTLRMQPGYDHSYYFIQSFIKDHIDFHARELGLA